MPSHLRSLWPLLCPMTSVPQSKPDAMQKEINNLQRRPIESAVSQERQVTVKPSIRTFLRTAFLLSLVVFAVPASAADLKPQTIAAFDHYVALSEAKINSSLNDPPGDPQPFLSVDSLPAPQRCAPRIWPSSALDTSSSRASLRLTTANQSPLPAE